MTVICVSLKDTNTQGTTLGTDPFASGGGGSAAPAQNYGLRAGNTKLSGNLTNDELEEDEE